MERQESRVHLAVFAGLFATCGSLFGKLSGGADYFETYMVSLLAKGIFLILMVTCNTVGCTFFVKALRNCGSSLPATIISTATNYICSAFTGLLFFGETTSLTWWFGATLVLLGLVLISYVPAEENSTIAEGKLKHQ